MFLPLVNDPLVTMLRIFALLFTVSQSAHFVPLDGGSPIHICGMVGSPGRGKIFKGSVNSTNCLEPSSELVVVKCDKEGSLDEEFKKSKSISPIRNFVYDAVVALAQPDRVCFTMEYFGPSLASLRDKLTGTHWPWDAISVLGMRLVSQLAEIHASGYAHRDLHFMNVVARNRNVTDFESFMMQDPIIIDFGDAVELEHREDANILIQNDLMAVLVGLKYLVEGDYKFYTEKKYGFNPKTAMDKSSGGICIDTPPSYCGILTYMFSMKPSETPDYGFIISELTKY